MTGLGNDLIDLKLTDAARTQSPRFYSKILADTELQLYQSKFAAFPLQQFVWLLWSIKESAYKALQRYQPDLVFTPVKMAVVSLMPPINPHQPAFENKTTSMGFNDAVCFKSIIHFNSQTLYARSVIYGDELIHTVACADDDFRNIHWGIRRVMETGPAGQSLTVREFLLAELSSLFPAFKLAVEKSLSGYPFITSDGVAMDLPVSLSHHGEFVGYGAQVFGRNI
jgi:phosphopantetheinyl transferase (holo-ACP synthase)